MSFGSSWVHLCGVWILSPGLSIQILLELQRRQKGCHIRRLNALWVNHFKPFGLGGAEQSLVRRNQNAGNRRSHQSGTLEKGLQNRSVGRVQIVSLNEIDAIQDIIEFQANDNELRFVYDFVSQCRLGCRLALADRLPLLCFRKSAAKVSE